MILPVLLAGFCAKLAQAITIDGYLSPAVKPSTIPTVDIDKATSLANISLADLDSLLGQYKARVIPADTTEDEKRSKLIELKGNVSVLLSAVDAFKHRSPMQNFEDAMNHKLVHLLKFMIVDPEAADTLKNNVKYRIATFGRGFIPMEDDGTDFASIMFAEHLLTSGEIQHSKDLPRIEDNRTYCFADKEIYMSDILLADNPKPLEYIKDGTINPKNRLALLEAIKSFEEMGEEACAAEASVTEQFPPVLDTSSIIKSAINLIIQYDAIDVAKYFGFTAGSLVPYATFMAKYRAEKLLGWVIGEKIEIVENANLSDQALSDYEKRINQLSANLKGHKMDQAALVWLSKMIPKNIKPSWHFTILAQYGTVEEVTDLFSTKIKTWNKNYADYVLFSERPEVLRLAWYNGLKEVLPSLDSLDYIYYSADADLIPVIHDALSNIHRKSIVPDSIDLGAYARRGDVQAIDAACKLDVRPNVKTSWFDSDEETILKVLSHVHQQYPEARVCGDFECDAKEVFLRGKFKVVKWYEVTCERKLTITKQDLKSNLHKIRDFISYENAALLDYVWNNSPLVLPSVFSGYLGPAAHKWLVRKYLQTFHELERKKVSSEELMAELVQDMTKLVINEDGEKAAKECQVRHEKVKAELEELQLKFNCLNQIIKTVLGQIFSKPDSWNALLEARILQIEKLSKAIFKNYQKNASLEAHLLQLGEPATFKDPWDYSANFTAWSAIQGFDIDKLIFDYVKDIKPNSSPSDLKDFKNTIRKHLSTRAFICKLTSLGLLDSSDFQAMPAGPFKCPCLTSEKVDELFESGSLPPWIMDPMGIAPSAKVLQDPKVWLKFNRDKMTLIIEAYERKNGKIGPKFRQCLELIADGVVVSELPSITE